MADRLLTATALIIWTSTLLAQPQPIIEEIIVTAQRVEESAQKVPISVTAFDTAAIEDRQIIGIIDVQLYTPNVAATETNFGLRKLSIRGAGRLTEGGVSPQNAVSYHINEIPAQPYSLTEFYDLERIEVLRGPQGTLFGRNSTAGAVNVVTQRPGFGDISGTLSVDVGNYDLVRWKGALEATLTDSFALRIAGLKLDRDGYITNLADGQVPDVDSDLDGRDLYSLRITPDWRISETTTLWGLYERTREKDDRVRITNQVCKTNPLPTNACDPDAFGLEPLNHLSTAFGLLSVLLGQVDLAEGLVFDHPRPELGLRDQHTDFEPVFDYERDFWMLELDHERDSFDVSVSGSYQKIGYSSQQDRYMDIGFTLSPTPFNTEGLWPVSIPPTTLQEPLGNPCNVFEGLAGVSGGCAVEGLTRFFAYDQILEDRRSWTIEAKLRSHREGSWNWLLGGLYVDNEFEGLFVQPNNILDGVSSYGIPPLEALPMYPSLDGALQTGDLESFSTFGEVYWQPAESLKITLGMRYTEDTVKSRGTRLLFNAFGIPGDPGGSVTWIRQELASWLSGTPDDVAVALTDFYGVTDAARAASGGQDLAAVLASVPPVAPLGEAQDVFGVPDSFSTDVWTGRLGVDWAVVPDAMVYAFYSRGSNPGGVQAAFFSPERFDDERVDAFELGFKSRLRDDSLLLNVAAFYNAYDGIHVDRRVGNARSIVVDNMDADVWGLEIESRWLPTANLDIELAYGWLGSKIGEFQVLDPVDLTQGDSSLVLLKNVPPLRPDAGALADNYVASRADVLAVTPQAIEAGAAVPVPGALYPDGIPAYFSQAYLADRGVTVSPGVPANLKGNKLPLTPEHTVHLGVAYTWFRSFGGITLRWDYYWQDEMYSRSFNRIGDRIESWDQHNASLTFVSADGNWTVKGWIRNIENEDNVTDHFLNSVEGGGAYRNYFLAEPRVFGATVRYDFGRY